MSAIASFDHHSRHVRVLLRRRRHGGQTRTSPKGEKKPEATITLATKPTPPAPGQTTFTVVAKDADGKPITGADVSVEFVMPPMAAMEEDEEQGRAETVDRSETGGRRNVRRHRPNPDGRDVGASRLTSEWAARVSQRRN